MSKKQQLRELADRIDHEQLWRWAGMDHGKMTAEQKDRYNAGVALRRYADLQEPGRWVLFPPSGAVHYSASTLEAVSKMAVRWRAPSEPNTYTTQPGESVAGIALRELGTDERWHEIAKLNEDRFPHMIHNEYYPVGTVLKMPAKGKS